MELNSIQAVIETSLSISVSEMDKSLSAGIKALLVFKKATRLS